MPRNSKESKILRPEISEIEPLIVVDHVSKSFKIHVEKSLKGFLTSWRKTKIRGSRFKSLSDINLKVLPGETVGLMGHNGSGKSTLLKIIGGIISTESGSIYRRGRIAALLELGTGFHPDLTGRQNIFLNASILGMSKAETERVFDEIVDFSGIPDFIDTQVKFYSSGMYVRLAFAVAVHSDPDLLLIDEVLAVGDEPFQQKCIDKIREFQREGRTILFVSHSADQVASICTRGVVLEKGSIVYDGPVNAAIRTLHLGYERVMEAELDAKNIRDRANQSQKKLPVEITKLVARDELGPISDSRAIANKTNLEVSIFVDVHVEMDWVTGFTFSRPDGGEIYRLNTEGLSKTLPRHPGKYKIDFKINGCNFSGGRIMLTAGVSTPAGVSLFRFPNKIEILTTPDPHGAGSVQFPVDCSVTSLGVQIP